ncbi:MAG: TIGR00730 family Rossman fold protein [Dehalococcoidia bacterium]
MVVGKRPRRPYRTGDEALDARIEELIEASGVEDGDLVREMVTTCFRVARDRADRGEMKLVNAALKEFAYAFKVFKRYRGVRKVSIFGSSRSGPGDPEYDCARRFAEAIAERGWMVITGAGPGIMEAGHEGAGAERSFGAAIRLPMEAEPNVVIEGDPKLINFKYFFTRKVTFLKESDAFALLPGGFGTLDEAFELLTLMQTGKSDLHPIVLLETEGGEYWSDWRRFMEERLLGRGLISAEDMDLVKITDSIEDAVVEIERFYTNYDSQRYVEGTLVLRLQRLPDGASLERLSREFGDILRSGGLRPVEPSAAEVAEGDRPELARLAVAFNQRSQGRLRHLIDALNGF